MSHIYLLCLKLSFRCSMLDNETMRHPASLARLCLTCESSRPWRENLRDPDVGCGLALLPVMIRAGRCAYYLHAFPARCSGGESRILPQGPLHVIAHMHASPAKSTCPSPLSPAIPRPWRCNSGVILVGGCCFIAQLPVAFSLLGEATSGGWA